MNSNQTHTTKSVSELKQQVLNDIQKVKDDFKEIQSRMTPGQMIDDAIYYRRGDRNPAQTFEFLKANPIGTSLLTLGTILLMEDDITHKTWEMRASSQIGAVRSKVQGAVAQTKGAYDRVKTTVSSHLPHSTDTSSPISDLGQRLDSKFNDIQSNFEGVSANIQGTASETVSTARSAIQDAKSNITDKALHAREQIGEAVDSLRDSTTGAMHSVGDKAHGVVDSLRSATSGVVDSARHLDPLTYLALGAGLGTITGAAIPVSDTESSAVDSFAEDKFAKFSEELQAALNSSMNILKNEFIGSATEMSFKLF
jgi:hypothetical protein